MNNMLFYSDIEKEAKTMLILANSYLNKGDNMVR